MRTRSRYHAVAAAEQVSARTHAYGNSDARVRAQRDMFQQPLGTQESHMLPLSRVEKGGALDKLNPLFPFSDMRTHHEPSEHLVRPYNSKDQTYADTSTFLGVTLFGLAIERRNAFTTEELMPVRLYENPYFRWRRLRFNLMPAVLTAQQAVPPKLGFAPGEGKATMSRFALAIEGSLEFDRTTYGQMVVEGLVNQLGMAFMCTMELLVFRALFKAPLVYQRYAFEAQIFATDPTRKMHIELSRFDAFHRWPLALQTLVAQINQDYSDTLGLNITHLILPPGAKLTLSQDPNMRTYSIRGDGNKQFQDQQGAAPFLQRGPNGERIFVARPYYFDAIGTTIHPLQRTVTFASFGFAADFQPGAAAQNYLTSDSEPGMFTMKDGGSFCRIRRNWLLDNDSRWAPDGTLAPQHKDLAKLNFAFTQKHGIPVPNKELDMMLYFTETTNGDVIDQVSHFGHMEQWALKDIAVKRIAEASWARVLAIIGKDKAKNLEESAVIIRRIRSKQPTPVDDGFMLQSTTNALVPDPATSTGAATSVANQVAGNLYGGQDLPRGDTLSGIAGFPSSGYLPPGYGTVSGLLTIGDQASASPTEYSYIAEDVLRVAGPFRDSLESLMNAFAQIYNTDAGDQSKRFTPHPAIDARFAPAAYRSSDTGPAGEAINRLLAFGYNIWSAIYLPAYQTRTFGIPANAPPAGVDTNGLAAYFAGRGDYATVFDGIQAMLATGAPIRVNQVFSSPAAFVAFEQAFESGPFGAAYRAKLSEEVREAGLRRAGAGTRPLRTFAATVDVDQDEAVARELDIASRTAAGQSLLFQFHENEVLRPGASEQQAARLYSIVVPHVLDGTTPAPVLTAGMINAWKGSDADRATAGVAFNAGRNANAYLTRLSVPYENLRPNLGLASPLNAGAVIRKGDAANAAVAAELARSSASDLDLTTVFASASARGGVRQSAQPLMPAPQQPSFSQSVGQPSYFGSIFTDVVPNARGDGRSWLVVNKNIRDRYRAANSMGNHGLQMAAKMFLMAPVTRQVYKSFANNDIPLPGDHLIIKIAKFYVTNAMIAIAADPRNPIGFTAVHDPRVNYASSAATETWFMHAVMYMTAIGTRNDRVITLPDVSIAKYINGDNLTAFSPQTFNPRTLQQRGEKDPSLIITMEPAYSLLCEGDHSIGTSFDVRGKWGVRSASGVVHHKEYSSAPYLNMHYPLYELRPITQPDNGEDGLGFRFASMTADATVAFRERMKIYLGGAATPTAELPGFDHFGDTTEDGAGTRRRGDDQSPYEVDKQRQLPILSY